MRLINIAAVGDSNDINTWSGIPYHLVKYARLAGLNVVALPMRTNLGIIKANRLSWNLWRVLSGAGKGGFQFSETFLSLLWRNVSPGQLSDSIVINCFQLYPHSVLVDNTIRRLFFIDQTLRQLFRDYTLVGTPDELFRDSIIQREALGYERATLICAHSSWAADSLVREYNVPDYKIRVVVPGANLAREVSSSFALRETKRLRLVFVGKDWSRKGLPRLLEGFQLALTRGFPGTLRVIGCERGQLPEGLRNVANVEWLGYIDKHTSAEYFQQVIGECDVGCLLSTAEAGGIAIREFCALGLLTLTTTVGGVADHLNLPSAVLLPANASAEQVAGAMLGLVADETRYKQMKRAAWANRALAEWPNTIARLKECIEQLSSPCC